MAVLVCFVCSREMRSSAEGRRGDALTPPRPVSAVSAVSSVRSVCSVAVSARPDARETSRFRNMLGSIDIFFRYLIFRVQKFVLTAMLFATRLGNEPV